MSVAAHFEQLAPTFTGELLQPTDAGYDKARRVYNGLIDKRPGLIARCHGTADVADAVRLARSLNLEIAVKGGGHNVGGRGTIDGGVMIDLAPTRLLRARTTLCSTSHPTFARMRSSVGASVGPQCPAPRMVPQ